MLTICKWLGQRFWQFFSQTYLVTLMAADQNAAVFFSDDGTATGLPDFSWYNIPKREKCTQKP
jgi:hypothetical protein